MSHDDNVRRLGSTHADHDQGVPDVSRRKSGIALATAILIASGGTAVIAQSNDAGEAKMSVQLQDASGAVTWAGDCPVSVSETKVAEVGAVCRDLGYRGPNALVSTMDRLGAMTMTERVDDAIRGRAVLGTRSLTVTIYPGPASPGLKTVFEERCRLDGSRHVVGCSRENRPARRSARRR